jgi:SAM-dependent methyltransferase
MPWLRVILGVVPEGWEWQAEDWLAWARTPEHDSYWTFTRPFTFSLLSEPGCAALDLGCGEGRLTRDLAHAGYRVVGIDASPSLIEHALAAHPEGKYHVADAAQLPFEDGTFELVVSQHSLQDIDDMTGAVREASRVLSTGGAFVVVIEHPMTTAGEWDGRDADARFVFEQSYREARLLDRPFERDGMRVNFRSWHRPLQVYTDAFAAAGLTLELLSEVYAPESPRWSRLPPFLGLRLRKP